MEVSEKSPKVAYEPSQDSSGTSQGETLDGHQLLETVVSLTGLPGEMVDEELRGLLAAQEQDAASLTLDGLRAVMLAYLESIQEEMTAHAEAGESLPQ